MGVYLVRKEKAMICRVCGALVGKNHFMVIDGDVVCDDCYVFCEECDEPVIITDAIDTRNGYVCECCLDNYYTRCYNCDEYVRSEDVTYIDDEHYCSDCVDELYTTCDDCGELIRHSRTYNVSRGEVCERCYENYVECNDCGRIRHNEDMFWSDRDDCYYCEDCYNNHNSVIYGYHDFNDFRLRRTADDIQNNNEIGFGFELEVEGDEDYAEDFLDIMGGERDLVLMHDGSVDGFEIVTQPMTKNYFEEVFKNKLDAGLKFLRESHFSGHNKGGLHIHVSSEAITTGMLAQLHEILYSHNLDDKNTWLRLTQRKEYELDHWSGVDNDNYNFDEIINEGYRRISEDRYTALNWDSRTNTYEFRIFNSNIRMERFMKNFECVQALLDYTVMYKDCTKPQCDTQGFLSFVENNSLFYPNLFAFMEEMNIKAKYGTEITEQELEVA